MSALALAAALAAATAAPAATGPEARLLEANARYLAGDFEGAAARYAELAEAGLGGATLHLNRGNALLRAGRRGEAIASYLRALREDPGDADAAANLALARGANADRLAGAPRRSLPARLAARTPDAAAAAALAIPWVLLWAALAARRAAPRARSWLGGAAVALAAAALLGAGLLAARDAELRRAAAVVVAPSAPAREAPEDALRPAFEVHEGTLLDVLEVRGGHARVALGSGLEGWVPSSALEPIRPGARLSRAAAGP